MMELPDFSQTRVLVVGDVMLDRYWQGGTSRISPEAPVPVVQINEREDRAGGAGNVALNLATLGVQTTLIGQVGDDEAGDSLAQCLRQSGVEPEFVCERGASTITKLRILSRHQQLIRLDADGQFHQSDATAIEQRVEACLSGVDVLVASDYSKGCLQNVQALIAQAVARRIPVVIDPKGTEFERYRGATVLTPNLSEFQAVVGECADEEMLREKASALCESLDLQALLVTRSEKGMLLALRNGEHFTLPTKAREVFDVTGAGDTVVAVLAAALASGCAWRQAVSLANTAAGVVVGKVGTSSVTLDELRKASLLPLADRQGIVSEAELVQLRELSRRRGERLVFTNGCFDLLHPGHVSYLEAARQLGDRLVVAVNADASVKQLKGPTRPINDVQARMAVLAGLRSVDWVLPFSEETPARLIEAIVPDVLVKGGDYTVEQIVGAETVLAAGGEVKSLAFLDGYSTTKMINAIQ